MESIEITGSNRAADGKKAVKRVRTEGNVPCVLYGGDENVNFSVLAKKFKNLIYTPSVYIVKLNIDGKEYDAIMQDVQFHPVSELILHADFLQLFDEKSIKMDIPVNLVGTSPGVINGGVLVHKRRTIRVEALAKNMPDEIDVDISELDFHKSIKIEEVIAKDFTILDPGQASIAVVEIPRALKIEDEVDEEGEELEGVEGEEGEEGAGEGATSDGSTPSAAGDKKEETKE